MRLKPPYQLVMAKLRDDRGDASGPNQVWAMDWMNDELFDGRRIWVLPWSIPPTSFTIMPATAGQLDVAPKRHVSFIVAAGPYAGGCYSKRGAAAVPTGMYTNTWQV
jgi:hypothetical protein